MSTEKPSPPPALCPVCRSPMRLEQHGALTLDRCPGCSGLWFDRSELDAYYRLLPPVSTQLKAPQGVPGAQPLPCARCRTETLRSYRADAVLISRCTTCAGMYLDGNDLRALSGRRLPYGPVRHESAGAGERTGEVLGGVTAEMIVDILMTSGFRAAIAALKTL